uniref:Uncharacterized protein n=1 Tax=Anguilla anguilla TaxID=7936 RepID=A0A0E9QPW9_ANGAN
MHCPLLMGVTMHATTLHCHLHCHRASWTISVGNKGHSLLN